MTGYGRGECVLHDRNITVELRSVNNRYLDASVKIPRSFVFVEEKLKTRIQEHISRGKLDVFVSIESTKGEQVLVKVNPSVADAYHSALLELRDRYDLQDNISVSLLSHFPDIFTVEKEQTDLEIVSADLLQVLDIAIVDFNAMRKTEGEKLAKDILSRADRIASLLDTVEQQGTVALSEYRARLYRRMTEVLENTNIDENRILTEAAIFADKTAVDEETVRLRSHLTQLHDILTTGGIVGRKLDFLIQEFNREANTIGSKCSDVDITRIVLEIKGEIEKIREQVQNIE